MTVVLDSMTFNSPSPGLQAKSLCCKLFKDSELFQNVRDRDLFLKALVSFNLQVVFVSLAETANLASLGERLLQIHFQHAETAPLSRVLHFVSGFLFSFFFGE